MQFKRVSQVVGRDTLKLFVGDKIIGSVLITANGKWTYDISGLKFDSPSWYGLSDKIKLNECMIPYEEAYDTEHEASLALLKVFGE